MKCPSTYEPSTCVVTLHKQNKYSSTAEAIQIMRNLQPAVQDLFPVLKEYMKLLLVNPASSATAERSFSSLRRLKTWLRNSMCQMRLNNCAVCSAHVEALDNTTLPSWQQTLFPVWTCVRTYSANFQSVINK